MDLNCINSITQDPALYSNIAEINKLPDLVFQPAQLGS